MKKISKYALIVLMLSILVLHTIKGYQPSGLFYYKDLPCITLRKYSIGDLLSEDQISNETSDKLYLTDYHSGNVNSMEGLNLLPHPEKLEELSLEKTCVSKITNMEKLTNLRKLILRDTEITNIDALENMNMNNLEFLDLVGTNIETISGIENIRTDTTKNLQIIFDPKKVRHITKESYEYVTDPESNVDVALYNGKYMLDLNQLEWVE